MGLLAEPVNSFHRDHSFLHYICHEGLFQFAVWTPWWSRCAWLDYVRNKLHSKTWRRKEWDYCCLSWRRIACLYYSGLLLNISSHDNGTIAVLEWHARIFSKLSKCSLQAILTNPSVESFFGALFISLVSYTALSSFFSFWVTGFLYHTKSPSPREEHSRNHVTSGSFLKQLQIPSADESSLGKVRLCEEVVLFSISYWAGIYRNRRLCAFSLADGPLKQCCNRCRRISG